MKKFLLSLAIMAFAATAVNAQVAVQNAPQVKKECCKENKDGKKCDKLADQQCPDCKVKAADAQKHECKKAEGKQCEKAEGMKKDCCKKAEGQKCEKAEGMKCEKAAQKHECKKDEGKQCEKAEGMKKDCCKDKKEGQACTKPADQQCPDCKAKAAKKD